MIRILFQFVVVHFDQILGPTIFYTKNGPLSKEIELILYNILNLDLPEDYFEFIAKYNVIANIIFEIPSPVARGGQERVMLSIVTPNHQRIDNSQQILTKIAQIIAQEPEMYKDFCPEEKRKNNPNYTSKMKKLKQIIDEQEFTSEPVDHSDLFGQILIVGHEKVGKTTLIKRLTSGIMDPATRPTLGNQILKTTIENLNFNIYDVGGQKALRHLWFKAIEKPDFIIFITDLTRMEPEKAELEDTFSKVVDHFYKEGYDIPLLILGNKLDLIPIQERAAKYETLKLIFSACPQLVLKHIGLVSAATNEGVLYNFRWLAAQAINQHNVRKLAYNAVNAPIIQKSNALSEISSVFGVLHEIWIFTSTGIELFSSTSEITFDPTLLGGMISALQSFGQVFIKADLAYFVIGILKFSIFTEANSTCIIVGSSPRGELDSDIQIDLQRIFHRFVKEFGSLLVNFNGNVMPFRNFAQLYQESMEHEDSA